VTQRPGPALAGVTVADAAEAWERIGFTVQDGVVRIGSVAVELAGSGAGPARWTLRGVDPAAQADVDGLPTAFDEAGPGEAPEHPNGATRLDHVVIFTPDLDRTLEALLHTGFELRRTRDARTAGHPMRQAFLWAGDVILEVGGPYEPAGDGPAELWGMVVVVPDVDATAQRLGGHLGTPRPAVQPGRRIATVRRASGVAVPLAFITPHRRG
jgi:hypothetical protein